MYVTHITICSNGTECELDGERNVSKGNLPMAEEHRALSGDGDGGCVLTAQCSLLEGSKQK